MSSINEVETEITNVILSADGSVITVSSESVLKYDGIEQFLLMCQIMDGEIITTKEDFDNVEKLFFKNFVSELSGYKLYKLNAQARQNIWSENSDGYQALANEFSKLSLEAQFAFVERNFNIQNLDKYSILKLKNQILDAENDANFNEDCTLGIDYSYDSNKVLNFAGSCWTEKEYLEIELIEIYQKYCPLVGSKQFDNDELLKQN